MIRIVVGCILISCMAGVAGALVSHDLDFSTTTPTPTPAFVTCGSGCQCLFEFEIPTVFGESGRNYVKCSETPCGQGTVVEVRQYKYCFRPQQTPPAQQPPVQQPQAPAPGASTGSLSVSSIPSGASVTLDGQYRGNTPVTIRYLSPGYHDLRLSLSGYQDSVQSPSVSVGTTTALSISLTPSGQAVSQGSTGDQVGVVSLSDEVGVVRLADDATKLNPQPEPPKPADISKLNPQPEDLVKLNPQPEPPKPASTGFFDTLFGLFAGLFGGNTQGSTSAPGQGSGGTSSSMQLMGGTGCLGENIKECNGQCVDVQSDPKNCGGCGIPCGGLKVCSLGTCKAACDTGLTKCIDRSCVNLKTDRNNCGICRKKCDPTTQCSDGSCVGLFSNAHQIEGQEEAIARAVEKLTQITVLSPKEGDAYYYGQTIKISWNYPSDFPGNAGTPNINYELIKDGGAVLYKVQTPFATTYDWDLSIPYYMQVAPDQLSGISLAYIRVSTPDQKYFGRSGLFTIRGSQPDTKGGKITVTSPKTGDKVVWGANVKVVWDPKFPSDRTFQTITVDVIPESGKRSLLSVSCPNTGSCEFTLPDDTSPSSGIEKVYFKVSTVLFPYEGTTGLITIEESPFNKMNRPSLDTGRIKSTAENIPTIAKSPIRILKPTATDVITLGDTVEILWDPDFPRMPAYEDKIPITFINLYSENGKEITYIAFNIENNGRYTWPTLPKIDVNDPNFGLSFYRYKTLMEHPGRGYITIEAGNHIGKSEVFTIRSPSYITVTSPTRNNVIRWGDPIPITWDPPKLNDGTTIDKVSISALISGGKRAVISDDLQNTGSHIWESAKYQPVLGEAPKNVIIIITTPDGKRMGMSDTFTVLPPPTPNNMEVIIQNIRRLDDHEGYGDSWRTWVCPPSDVCFASPGTMKIGYNDDDPDGFGDSHNRYRGWIGVRVPRQPVKKALLTMHLVEKTHKIGDTATNEANLIIGSVWIMNGYHDPSFEGVDKFAQGYIGPGVNEDKWSFDEGSQVLTIDITDAVNQWVAGRANYGMLFLPNDEGLKDREETYTNTFDTITATYVLA